MSEILPTLAQALYTALVKQGYCKNRRQMADLIGINQGNVSHYLAERSAPTHIPTRLDNFSRWMRAVSDTTQLHVEVRHDGRETSLSVRGYHQDGTKIKEESYPVWVEPPEEKPVRLVAVPEPRPARNSA